MKTAGWCAAAWLAVAAAFGGTPEAVLDEGYLGAVAEHLYWWYLDEEDLDLGDGEWMEFRVRGLEPRTRDEGDRSEWAEIRIPGFRLGTVVKRPDYTIEETGVRVEGEGFRMANVFRLDEEGFGEEGEGWKTVRIPLGRLLEGIRGRRGGACFPSAGLTERMHRACRRQMELEVEGREAGDQVMHIAPLSPVANEAWVYLENGCELMQFTADDDLEEEGPWEALRVRTYNLRRVVASPEELPGSNVLMTMDQAGRALYNCVVLGKRLIVVNPEEAEGEALVREHVWGEGGGK